MTFLIEYDRATGRTVRFDTYKDSESRKAEDDRLRIELELNRRGLLMQHEVVVLTALDEQALRKTHQRYFKTLPQTVEPNR